jgi:hypothetical protein
VTRRGHNVEGEIVNEGQVRRYFIGLVGFGFVACLSAAGLSVALTSLAVCALVVVGPNLAQGRRRAPTDRRRAARARPLREEGPDELPLVPDDPSLIIELG